MTTSGTEGRRFSVSASELGTSEEAWLEAPQMTALTALTLPRYSDAVVVAAHPDDEVLGAAGLIQCLLGWGIPLRLVAVTDGESSHPRSAVAAALDMASMRRRESEEALRRLGWYDPPGHSERAIIRLGMPDGEVSAGKARLASEVALLLGPTSLCIAPWRSDGHPDHEACGLASAEAARRAGAALVEFPLWAWHWADPRHEDLPWAMLRRLELTPPQAERKRRATDAFVTQLEPLGPGPFDQPVLPRPVLRRFQRSFEVYAVGRRDRSGRDRSE